MEGAQRIWGRVALQLSIKATGGQLLLSSMILGLAKVAWVLDLAKTWPCSLESALAAQVTIGAARLVTADKDDWHLACTAVHIRM